MTQRNSSPLDDMTEALLAIDTARKHFIKWGIPKAQVAVLDDAITRINDVVKTHGDRMKK